jgi:hypothetical protein
MLFSYVPFGVTVMVLGCPDYLHEDEDEENGDPAEAASKPKGCVRGHPFSSCSTATHHSLMSDPHRTSFSNVGAHHAHHGLYHITSHLHIYHVPMFLDLAYV